MRGARLPALACAAVVVLAPALARPPAVRAQAGGAPALESEVGVYGEGYWVSGRESRRPEATLRFYASPSLQWMGMRLGGHFLWSTEQEFVAQDMNRYYLNPDWAWGELHVGDYVPTISRYTAQSMPVRGGGFELRPGPFRVAFAGGRAQEAARGSPFDAAPRRMLFSGRIGMGEPGATFVQLSALRAADDRDGTDSLGVQPQENLVGAIAAGVRTLDGRLTLRTDVSGSLFTRDTRSSEIGDLEVPGWFESLFTPRAGSRADYAWNVEGRMALGRGSSVGVQAEYVGAGFVSLGDPYLTNDRLEVRALGTMRMLEGRLNASGSIGRRNDNLADQKRGTTVRTTGTLTVTAIPTRAWTSTVSLLANGLSREVDLERRPGEPEPIAADSFRIANTTLSFTTIQQVRFEAAGLPQQLTLSYSEQRVDDSSPRFDAALDATNRSVSLEYGVTLAERYRVALRPGWQSFAGGGRDESFPSLSGSIATAGSRSRIGGRLGATYTSVRDGGQIRTTATGNVRMGERDRVTVQLRHTYLGGVENEYSETFTTIRYSRYW